MIFQNRNRYDDIRRTVFLSRALQELDEKSYLFREAYALGYPKFTDIKDAGTGQPMTAFVGIDSGGRFIFCWGRAFFDELLDDSEWPKRTTALSRVKFVLAHETLHVVFRHITRAKGKLPNIWNLAADITVNWYCQWYGLKPLPGSILAKNFPPDWGIQPKTQTTEEIYEILLRKAEVVPSFSPSSGHHDQWGDLDEKTKDILDSKITEAQAKAAARDAEGGQNSEHGKGRGCGKLPGTGASGELREFADQIVANGRVPWDTMLRRFLGSIYQPSVSERWDRLPTRLASQWGRVVLPSHRMDRTRTGIHLMAALDASASMTEDDIHRMACVLASLPDKYKVTLASFDTKCYLIDSLDEVRGGGGTSLDDVNRVAVEQDVDCVVCLTDGYFGSSGNRITRPCDWIFIIEGTRDYVPAESTVFCI